jgi:hypothetical protein
MDDYSKELIRSTVIAFSEYLPSIDSTFGLILYAIFAYITSLCCMSCMSRLGGDIDI